MNTHRTNITIVVLSLSPLVVGAVYLPDRLGSVPTRQPHAALAHPAVQLPSVSIEHATAMLPPEGPEPAGPRQSRDGREAD